MYQLVFFPSEMVKFGSEYLLKNVYKNVSSSGKEKNNGFLKKIYHLCLNDKSIDSIGDIAALENLTALYLHNNNIQSIENFDNLKKLKYLYLQHNNINKLENLGNLKNLRKLFIGHNCISVIEGLDTLTNLIELHIENQNLPPGETLYFDPRTVNALSQCLRVLDISKNKLTLISDLAGLYAMEKLDASCNQLEDLNDLCKTVTWWESLKQINLLGNPVVSERKFKDKIIANTARLEILNGKQINDVQRTFIKSFEMLKAEREERAQLPNTDQAPFSPEIASIARHLPPALRDSISKSIALEAATPKASRLTISLGEVPTPKTVRKTKGYELPSDGVLPRPTLRISPAEKEAQKRKKDMQQRRSEEPLPQLGENL